LNFASIRRDARQREQSFIFSTNYFSPHYKALAIGARLTILGLQRKRCSPVSVVVPHANYHPTKPRAAGISPNCSIYPLLTIISSLLLYADGRRNYHASDRNNWDARFGQASAGSLDDPAHRPVARFHRRRRSSRSHPPPLFA
jgi:hypothetical protein